MPDGTDPMLPRLWRVTDARVEMPDVATMELEPVEGEAPAFSPGQFNMIYPFGVGEAAISISGDPARPDRLVHTTRDVGAVSAAITRLQPGDIVGVRGPYGTSWPVAEETGREVVFVAGGLGLPPLRPAIHHVLAHRADYAGLSLVYGARSPDAIVYPDALREWKSRFDTEVEVTVDHAGLDWTGRVGVVTAPLEGVLASRDPTIVSAFICGPEIMMRFAAMTLVGAGVPQDRIWISMERNMKCGVGFCGHCQWGPHFVCRDGPVYRYDEVAHLLRIEEV